VSVAASQCLMSKSSSPPPYVRGPGVPFLVSLSGDRPLVRCDLAGSIAHVEMLERVGLVSPEESRILQGGLRAIGREVLAGSFPWRPDLEDVHTNVEARLTELVGPVGGKLHTARSRNDQIALDERLFLRGMAADIARRLLGVEEALLERGRQEASTPMPGYTHLQRAQPVTVGHWLLAHFWRFDRDIDRILSTAARADVSPLGAGALAGSTLPIDPVWVAERLGFGRPFDNSIDAVSDRDYFAEWLFDLGLIAVHASALAEEVVLFASKEFGFLERTASLGSGSSLMPQKRNPDVAELVRGKTGRVIGDLVALLTTLKGLPLAYDRDLQEDKPLVLDAQTTVSGALDALRDLIPRLEFRTDRLLAAASDPELYATDAAERMVHEGAVFRSAHESVGERYADPATPPADRAVDPGPAIERRATPGGPASAPFAAQLARARSSLSARGLSLSSLDRQVERIEELLNEEAK
jgi:argininosuccinate lyase